MDSAINAKIEKYAELVKARIPARMIILYGSYARGTENKDSDIDIAVVVDDLNDDFLSTSAELFTLTRQVDTSIEPKLIETKNNRSGFLESILSYGKVIYTSDNLK